MGVMMRTIIESENRVAEAFIINLYAGEPHKANQFDHMFDFSDGIDGWHINNWDNVEHGNATLAYDAEQQAMRISPNWDATDGENTRDVTYIFPEGEVGALAGPERPDGTPVYFILTVPDYYMSEPENYGMGFRFLFGQVQDQYDSSGFYRWQYQAEPLGDNQYCFGHRMLDDPRADVNNALSLTIQFDRQDLDTGGEPGPDILVNRIEIDRPPYIHRACSNHYGI